MKRFLIQSTWKGLEMKACDSIIKNNEKTNK